MENLKGQSSGKNWQNFLKLSSQQETPWLFLAVALSLHHLTAPDKSKKNANIYKQYQTIKLQDLMLILSPDTTRPCFSGFGV